MASEVVGVPVEKKLDARNFHEVHAAGLKIFTEILDTLTSHSARFFGNGSSYAKTMGLPEDAPKKKYYTSMKKSIRALQKEFTRKYNSVTTKDRRDAEGNPMPSRPGLSRIVRCSPSMSKFMKLEEWGLAAAGYPGQCYCTAGKATTYWNDYIKLNVLQNEDARYWKATPEVIEAFGADQFKRKNVDPNNVRFIDIQKLFAGEKGVVGGFAGHLTSIKKGILDPDLEADVRQKCADTSEEEFGGAVFRIHSLRGQLKALSDRYIKVVKFRNAANETRPGQGITKLWTNNVVEVEAEYAKIGAEVRKYCANYNFAVSAAFPPPLKIPAPRAAKEPKAPKEPTKRGPGAPKTAPAAAAKKK